MAVPPTPSWPARIRTERLVLRCWDPADAADLCEAIAASLPELQRWMPWARNEPELIEAKARTLAKFKAQFERGESYHYGIFDQNESRVLGSIGAHDRIGAGAREIGYWIRTDETCRGYCTEAAAALVRLGIQVAHLRRIEIHCHPDNLASAAIPRKLGFTHALTIPNCVATPTLAPRDSAIWVLKAAATA